MRLFLLSRLLTPKERRVLLITFLVLVVTLVIKSGSYYYFLTKEVPKVGGVYVEGLVGQPEFINPVLARSEIDKTVNSLIYQGLINLDNKNQVTPALATSYQISADQKSYTFTLRSGVTWQNGQPFTSGDVLYTFGLIKDPEQKSPFYNNFKDVLVEASDDVTVTFSLKNPYGPFLTNLYVGIIPQGRALTELNSRPIGTGPYSYINSTSKSGKIQSFIFERNENYWGDKPFIKRVEFKYLDSIRVTEELFEQEELNGVSLETNRVNTTKFEYNTSASIALIFNLRGAPFSDEALRKVIKDGQKGQTEISFDLLVADSPDLVRAADAFKEKIAPLGYTANVKVTKDNDLKDKINTKDYQALVIGIDFGHDFDPYSLWHSTQEATGLNLAGFVDKNADILLEDARLLSDPVPRQAKYNEFYKILDDKAVMITLEEKDYHFSIDSKFKNVTITNALAPSERLKDICSWYLETKRIKK